MLSDKTQSKGGELVFGETLEISKEIGLFHLFQALTGYCTLYHFK